MKCNRVFCRLFLVSLFPLVASSQQFSTGKATLGQSLDSVRAALGSGYHFDSHPLSDPAIVVTFASRANEEAYLLESFNGAVFYIEHQAFSDTGFNENDSKAAVIAKYGQHPSFGNDQMFWEMSLDFGHPCLRYGNNGLPWAGGGVQYVSSLNPNGNCQVSAMYMPLRGRMGVTKQLLPGYIFGIDVKLLDPTIAMPEFAKLAAAAQQKQQAAEQKARQVKPPL